MIIKRVGWQYGLNPQVLWEDTKRGCWGFNSHGYGTFESSKSDRYYFYKRYVQSLPKYEIQVVKQDKK